jgi:hypothetical protein
MSSTSEKGHAKNIANFKLLITQAEGVGVIYNPSNPDLATEALGALYDTNFFNQGTVNTATPPYSNAVNAREIIFKPLNRLVTKLRRVYKSTAGVTPVQLENFMTIARKIKGDRKVEIPRDDTEHHHSVAQLSYDQRTNSVDQLIALLTSTPGYNPNEVEYKIVTLTAMYNNMLVKTEAVNQTFVPLNNARTLRDNTMYLSPNNLVDTAYKAKDYLFTILDTDSAQYKSISKIRFSRK